MSVGFNTHLNRILSEIENNGLTKHERLISGQQDAHIRVRSKNGAERTMLNLCANNYLGLANHPEIVSAAGKALSIYGFGMSSVRFICGTQTLHRELELSIAKYVGKADAILFAACFDANGGVFEPLLEAEDAIISDSLNHASIIDGVRLCKAKRYRYTNGNMNELEDCLKQAKADGSRFRMIVTDGVFSMDGSLANLKEICALAETYDAQVLVDDCHATGHIGPQGRGTAALAGVGDKVAIVTGTFGKTLGGAMGGFVAADQPVIDLLRQRSRPYLFSNSLAPAVAAGSLKAIGIAHDADDRRAALVANTARFRTGLEAAGFELLPGKTPIIPVMLHDAQRSQAMARALDERGVFVAGFFFPVVAHGKARIRTQISASMREADIDFAISAFIDAGKALNII